MRKIKTGGDLWYHAAQYSQRRIATPPWRIQRESTSRDLATMKLTVISPTLNEAENVPHLVEQLERALGDIDYEILIVDDDSPDQTWSIAEKISLTNPRVRIL